MKILPKMKTLKKQHSNTFKMANLVNRNFKWLAGYTLDTQKYALYMLHLRSTDGVVVGVQTV